MPEALGVFRPPRRQLIAGEDRASTEKVQTPKNVWAFDFFYRDGLLTAPHARQKVGRADFRHHFDVSRWREQGLVSNADQRQQDKQHHGQQAGHQKGKECAMGHDRKNRVSAQPRRDTI